MVIAVVSMVVICIAWAAVSCKRKSYTDLVVVPDSNRWTHSKLFYHISTDSILIASYCTRSNMVYLFLDENTSIALNGVLNGDYVYIGDL